MAEKNLDTILFMVSTLKTMALWPGELSATFHEFYVQFVVPTAIAFFFL